MNSRLWNGLKISSLILASIIFSGCVSMPDADNSEVSWWHYDLEGINARCRNIDAQSIVFALLEDGNSVAMFIDGYQKNYLNRRKIYHASALYVGEIEGGKAVLEFENKRTPNKSRGFWGVETDQHFIEIVLPQINDENIGISVYYDDKYCERNQAQGLANKMNWEAIGISPISADFKQLREKSFPIEVMVKAERYHRVVRWQASVREDFEEIKGTIKTLDKTSPVSLGEANNMIDKFGENRRFYESAEWVDGLKNNLVDNDLNSLKKQIFSHWISKLDVVSYEADRLGVNNASRKSNDIVREFQSLVNKRPNTRRRVVKREYFGLLVSDLEHALEKKVWLLSKKSLKNELSKIGDISTLDDVATVVYQLKSLKEWRQSLTRSLALDFRKSTDYQEWLSKWMDGVGMREAEYSRWLDSNIDAWITNNAPMTKMGMGAMQDLAKKLYEVDLTRQIPRSASPTQRKVLGLLKERHLATRKQVCDIVPGFEYYKSLTCSM